MSIATNYAEVEKRIQAACNRNHRINREDVTLVAVSKLHPASSIREAYETTPLREFGENYVQELCEKIDELKDLDIRWHFIGHLQKNKARMLLSHKPALIQTVDSEQLADTLERIMAEIRPDEVQDVLIEVRLGDENTAKTGCPLNELESLSEHIASLSHLKLRGIMLVPPIEQDPEETRQWFKTMFELAGRMKERNDMSILSYGMSSDFEIAIEENATCVRVGTAIFGPRS
ncbi:MAG: YggS family pyridoxal phosphate-dependent enzyme [Proteobacteria bacterium]|nr:YggS family pyridoxal phosphate-dependent enzyme [Pseudomonadota bacterium]